MLRIGILFLFVFLLTPLFANAHGLIYLGHDVRTPVVVNNYLYPIEVTNSDVSRIPVVDLATGRVVHLLEAGKNARNPLILGDFLYVTNFSHDDSTLTVIDTNRNEVFATLDVVKQPRMPVVVGNKMYVASHDINTDKITVIDMRTHRVVNTIKLRNMGLFVAHGKLYASHRGTGALSIINTATDKVATTIELNAHTGTVYESVEPIVIGPNLYVLVKGDRSSILYVIDGITNAIIHEVISDKADDMVAVGEQIYMLRGKQNSVFVFDTTTNTIVKEIAVGRIPYRATTVGTDLYITAYGSVSVIDTQTNVVTKTIDLPKCYRPSRVGNRIYFQNEGAGPIQSIDIASQTLAPELNIDSGGTYPLAHEGKLYFPTYDGLVIVEENSL